MSGLAVGCASAVITPPVGTPMDGYSDRPGVSQGVHDDLHARALVFDDGRTRAALVSCELLDVDRHLVAAARRQAREGTGIPAANGQKRPAGLKVGRCAVDSVSQNRRDPSWPIDTALRLLLVDSPEP